MASNAKLAMASNLRAMASNLFSSDGLQPDERWPLNLPDTMASNLLAMASNLRAMASNLLAMASNLSSDGLQPTEQWNNGSNLHSDGLQPKSGWPPTY